MLHEDGGRSQTEFVAHALRFYLDYLATNNTGTLLPTAISSAIDGRLRMFEDRVLKLLFKQAVEFDMGMGVIADSMELSEEYLRMRRTKSIANVKATNGQLRFEKIVKDAYDEYDEDDGWQS